MSSASSVLATRCLIKPKRRLLTDLIVLLIFLFRSAAITVGIVKAFSMYNHEDE